MTLTPCLLPTIILICIGLLLFLVYQFPQIHLNKITLTNWITTIFFGPLAVVYLLIFKLRYDAKRAKLKASKRFVLFIHIGVVNPFALKTIQVLNKVTANFPVEIIGLCSPEYYSYLMKQRNINNFGLNVRIVDIIPGIPIMYKQQVSESRLGPIQEYLMLHPQIAGYLVIDEPDLSRYVYYNTADTLELSEHIKNNLIPFSPQYGLSRQSAAKLTHKLEKHLRETL